MTLAESMMKIEVTRIDKSNSVLVTGGQSLGFKCCFRCKTTEGSAVFVPYSGRGHNLEVGHYISVETSQESISDFAILSADTPHQMTPLPTSGDYDVIGTVELNGDDEIFHIDVDDFSFTLGIKDTGGMKPLPGQRVRFTVHGLELYDEYF